MIGKQSRTTLALLFAATLTMMSKTPALQAQPAELFFSEYIEGSSNNKALEIYNGTGVAVDLATGGYNVQMHFNGNPVATLTINLIGTVAAGDVFVLAQSSATAAILAQADQTNGSGWYNGDDAVVLRKGTTIIDVIGQIGVDPGTEWGSGLTSTADNTLRRKSVVALGDANGADAFDPAVEWEGFATDTFSGLGSYLSDSAPTVLSVNPGNGAANVSPGASITVAFSEPVNVSGNWFTLSCTSGPVQATAFGGPTTFTIDPSANLAFADVCTFTVIAGQVTDQDSIDPPDAMVADFVSTFTVTPDPCAQPFTPIYRIQGSGPVAAITGPVTTKGVVVGDYEGPVPTLRGFYIQDATGDNNPLTSDGVFVFNGNNNNVAVGDVVHVGGVAAEFQGQTQISASSVVVCGAGNVAPVTVTFPVASLTELERYEGMLVQLPQTMYVTEHFQLGRFGQVVLSAGARLAQPTSAVAPGAPAQAVAAANSLNRIILDDASQGQNPDPIVFARGGLPLSEGNTLRGGDSVTGAVGVLTYTWAGNAASGNAYRLRPVNALGGTALFQAENPRPDSAPSVGGSLRVAGANVLNYYNTFGADCPVGVSGGSLECRGADTDVEFERQRAKTIAAIRATGADVLGVIEIENDGYGPESAIQNLIDGLNAASGPGTWAFIDADAATGVIDVLGSDGIKVAIIYKPAAVTPVGHTAAINTGAFGLFTLADGRIQQRNRPSLAQSFEIATGARVTIVVNHLISKSASCELNVSPVGADPDTGDGQGVCNQTRVAAMQELLAWLATDPTGVADPDYLLLGDFNAYSKEDPIGVLESAGFTNMVPAFGGAGTYSFVFDGQWGSLDHALASASLVGQTTGAAPYHINADEPGVLDYNMEFKSAGQLLSLYADNEFRAGDHDPVVVGIDLNAAPVVSAGGPYTVTQGQTILLQATGHDPDGDALTFDWDLDNNGSFETSGVNALFTATNAVGTFTVRVRATDSRGLSAVAPATVSVLFDWTGFYAPILNAPEINIARAGNAVPIKFNLGGNQGLAIFAAGFPVSFEVNCTTGAPGASSPTTNPGGAGLTYDERSQQYVYVWQTDPSWAGSCRRLAVQLIDGSMHDTVFRFR